jgi:hypothetical protein
MNLRGARRGVSVCKRSFSDVCERDQVSKKEKRERRKQTRIKEREREKERERAAMKKKKKVEERQYGRLKGKKGKCSIIFYEVVIELISLCVLVLFITWGVSTDVLSLSNQNRGREWERDRQQRQTERGRDN